MSESEEIDACSNELRHGTSETKILDMELDQSKHEISIQLFWLCPSLD